MANMTQREQYMLELINQARLNPTAAATAHGIALNAGVSAGATISVAPKQVLAGSDALRSAAFAHSDWEIVHDKFTATETSGTSGFVGVSAFDRMKHFGYDFSGVYKYGENINWTGTVGATASTADLTAMIKTQFDNLFLSANNRVRMLDAAFQEAGIGQQAGNFLSGGKTYFASMITEDFAAAGDKEFITGVIYNDTVINDNFFSVGEGTPSIHVSALGGVTAISGTGGGYDLGFSGTGVTTVTYKLPAHTISVDVAIPTPQNVKLDVVNSKEIWTNATIASESTAITELHALGIARMDMTGSAASELIVGNNAVNVLSGNGGNDSISAGTGNDSLYGGGGRDSLSGGAGSDMFVFNTALGASNIDIIADFTHGTDKIALENNVIFAALGTATGPLKLAMFVERATDNHAQNASQHIIYDKADGTLWYDSDGSAGTHAPIEFAVLGTTTHPPTITSADFSVI